MKFKFRRIRLQTMLFCMFSLLLVFCLIIASLTIIFMANNLYLEETIATSQRDLKLISNSLESTLQRISNTAVSISSDSRIISTVKRHSDAPQTEKEKSILRSTLGLNIGTIIGASSDVFMWDIFSLAGDPFCISGYDLSRISGSLSDDFFESAAQTLRMQISGVYIYDSPLSSSVKPIPVFIVTKAIVDLDTRTPLGILMLLVRENKISNLLVDGTSGMDVTFTVLNDSNRIISSLNKDYLGLLPTEITPLSDDQFEILSQHGSLTTGSYASNTFYALSNPLNNSYSDWRILMINPMTYANESWQNTTITVVFFCTAISLVLFLVSYVISRSLSQPVLHLANSIHNTIKYGKMQPVPDPSGSYETNILYQSYNELLDHINALIDHINREQEEKSNYQFQLIQAQIKPHFLYNTLMTIKSLIDLDMNETASECIYAMSSFYRLSLNKGNDILKTGDEIELSMQYMYIQKLRYIDKLDYVFDVPQSLHPYYIPKMTIQPILENAIYHGVKEKADKGIIKVTGRDMEDRMEITVMDNGLGMTAQTLAQLRASINSRDADIQPHNESFGLYSVNRRIRMLYGESYGLYIDSRLGEYTTVTLVLPKNTSVGGIS